MLSGGLLRFYFTKIVGESTGLDYWGSYEEGEEGWGLQQPALNLGGPHAFCTVPEKSTQSVALLICKAKPVAPSGQVA